MSGKFAVGTFAWDISPWENLLNGNFAVRNFCHKKFHDRKFLSTDVSPYKNFAVENFKRLVSAFNFNFDAHIFQTDRILFTAYM